MALLLLPVASSCSNVAYADQIGLSRRRRYPSKQEEGRDTTQGTALCRSIDSPERCRADCDGGKNKKKVVCSGSGVVCQGRTGGFK